jgi:ubiquinone/menaquinone biosynthesis C-methylase UbiE
MPVLPEDVARRIDRARVVTTTIDPIRSREVRPMLRRLDLQPTDRVLDIGCAFGVWTNHLGKRVGHATGVDPDGSALRTGRRLFPGIDLVEGDARNLPWPDATFDKVVFISTLEHVEDPEAAVEDIARVLKPGGRAAISVDTLDHPAWRPLREEHARRSYVVEYLSRDRLLEMASRHGLELEWGRYLYGNDLSPRLLKLRLKPSPLHWLVAPAVRLSGALDVSDSGMMFQSVLRKRP